MKMLLKKLLPSRPLIVPYLGLLMSQAGLAVAQEQDGARVDRAGDPAPVFRLAPIAVVGSKENIMELPGSAAFIEAEEFQKYNYDDINRVLRTVPGVYVREEDGFGLFPNISIRGIDSTRSSKITVMEDGVLTAPATYAAPAAYYRPTIGRMSAVEVLKGSSQIRYGPHTTGGVINYLSTPIPKSRAAYVRSAFGENEDLRVHAYFGDTVDTPAGRVGYLVEGFFRRNDGFKTIDTTPDFLGGGDTGFDIFEPMVKFSWAPDSGVYQRFEVKVGLTDLEAKETYLGLTEADFDADPFRRYAASRCDDFESDHQRTYLRHYIEPTDTVNVTTTVYYNRFKRNWFKLQKVNGTNPSVALASGGADLATLKGEGPGTLRLRANNRSYWAWGAETVVNPNIVTGPLQHDVNLGLRYNWDRVRRFQRDDDFTQAADGTITGRTFGMPGGGGDREQTVAAVAAFLEDAVSFGRWTVRPGVRFERLWLDFEDRNDPAADGNGQMSVFAPGAGATLDLTERWTFFAGLYRGFSTPSPSGFIKDGVQEETSLATELGARYEDHAVTGSLTLFRTKFEDMIVIDNIGGAGTGTTENVGEAESLGVELSLGYDPGVANGWSFNNPYFLNFTYTKARLVGDSNSTDPESVFSGGKDGNVIPYIPEYLVNFGTGVEFEEIAVDFMGTYVPETFTTASNTVLQLRPDGTPDARFGKTDAYLLLEISGSYRIAPGIRLVGGVQNLLDQEYIASRHPDGPRPGKPLFAWVSLETEF